MNGRVPARIEREAFDRILRRAAELQAHGRDIGEGLSEEEVLELGREVGIPEANLRQALLEERTRIATPHPDGVLDRWIAPDEVVAERVVQGTVEAIGASLTDWLEKHEVLVVQRSAPGRITWEQASSFAGAMKRVGWAFNASKSRPYLGKVNLLTAVMTPLEPGFCHVALVASLGGVRAGYIGGGAGVAGAIGMGGVIAVVSGAAPIVAAIAAVPALTAGWFISRAFRPIAERTRLGLERALDHLEFRPSLPSTPNRLAGRSLAQDLGKALTEITREVKRAIEEKK